MATRNIQMNYYNGTDYDVLYPQTNMSQVDSLNSTISEIQSSVSGFQSQLNGKLNLSGGTMTGNLTLRGDPTSNLMAATKQYVDNNINTNINNIVINGLVEDVLYTKTFQINMQSTNNYSIETGINYQEIEEILNKATFLKIECNLSIVAVNNATISPIFSFSCDKPVNINPIYFLETFEIYKPNSNISSIYITPLFAYRFVNPSYRTIENDERFISNKYGWLSYTNKLGKISSNSFQKIIITSASSESNVNGNVILSFYGVK